MGLLVYSVICSLDGYTNDAGGGFAWAAPDEEVHAFVNAQEAGVGTYLYGRRMYETMQVWQDLGSAPDEAREVVEYAELWRAADKVVFSTTLTEVGTPRTELLAAVEPEVVAARLDAIEGPVSIGGPTLAGWALGAGMVDEVKLYVVPVVVGGGTRALPDGVGLDLTLREERRFANGTVFLHYAVGQAAATTTP